MKRALGAAALLILVAPEARAWPAPLMQALLRDARRLVPRSLGLLIQERETQVLEEARRFPPELNQALVVDLSSGALQPRTLAALEAHAAQAVDLVRQRRLGDGIIRLGATFRIAADLSDPVLAAGPEGYPAGVVREYYAFVEGNLDKIPVVLDDAPALKLERRNLTVYWEGLLGRSRSQSAVILTELYQNGRVVDHSLLDYRSPVFGVASLSYSRAVTAIAATWLVFWREVRGDLTRPPKPVVIGPSEAPADPLAPPAARQKPPLSRRRRQRRWTRLFGGRRPPF